MRYLKCLTFTTCSFDISVGFIAEYATLNDIIDLSNTKNNTFV